MGVHESQSRLWENHVGRHRGFWEGVIGRFNEIFPTSAASVESLWPILHKIERSLIRVYADEVTYSLHILVRFRLERALLSGGLSTDDLRGAWSDAYDELLGIRPQNDVEGVLQDIHWSQGLFGYFPTYCLWAACSVRSCSRQPKGISVTTLRRSRSSTSLPCCNGCERTCTRAARD
jgi:carboxypeptidase Taq